MAKTAWGIELGTSSIKAVRLTEDRGTVTLDTISIVSLNDYGLSGGTSVADATSAALAAFRVANGIKRGEPVYVSIKGQNTLGRIISLPPVSDEKVRETIENEAKSQVPIPLDQAVWDYQTIDDPTAVDERKVNLYAAKKQAVEEIVDACEAAGLEITGIQVAPLGIYNYIKFELDESVSSCCVAIDIGAENTDLVVIDGQKTYVRVVPVAGNDITKALKARFKLSDDDAEKLKRRAAKSKDAAAVFEAMKPPLKEMVGEIYRAVGFYKSQNESANINQLVMMGNGSKLINIQKFFEQQLQYKVHKVETPARLQLSRSVDPAEVQDNIQSLTVAIGLGLEALGVAGLNTINLMPRERLEAREKAKLKVPMIAAGAMMFVGGLVALVLGVGSAGGKEQKIATATNAEAAVAEASGKVALAQQNEENELRARSFKNLALGRVGAVKYTVPGKDGEAAREETRCFELPVRMLPGLVARAVDTAIAEYCDSSKEDKVLRINNPGEGSGNASMVLRPTLYETALVPLEAPAAGETASPDAPRYFTAKRELRYEASLGAIVQLASQQAAAVDRAAEVLVGGRDGNGGLVAQKLAAALLAELKASNQLEGLSEQTIKDIKWENLTIKVLSDVTPGNTALMVGAGIPGKPFLQDTLGDRTKLDKRFFAPFRVQVTLRLDSIEPPPAEATKQ
ncbi:MAG TPA: type IV pilus assembly protein PilM [Planctomycetota bacterium]|nr:type IV pilus assembly protein PilM [Planctomycetota bacterium]